MALESAGWVRATFPATFPATPRTGLERGAEPCWASGLPARPSGEGPGVGALRTPAAGSGGLVHARSTDVSARPLTPVTAASPGPAASREPPRPRVQPAPQGSGVLLHLHLLRLGSKQAQNSPPGLLPPAPRLTLFPPSVSPDCIPGPGPVLGFTSSARCRAQVAVRIFVRDGVTLEAHMLSQISSAFLFCLFF